jgi:hypothetical protein
LWLMMVCLAELYQKSISGHRSISEFLGSQAT